MINSELAFASEQSIICRDLGSLTGIASAMIIVGTKCEWIFTTDHQYTIQRSGVYIQVSLCQAKPDFRRSRSPALACDGMKRLSSLDTIQYSTKHAYYPLKTCSLFRRTVGRSSYFINLVPFRDFMSASSKVGP